MNTEYCNTVKVSDELLNAFVDGELDAAEKARLLNCMASDASAQLRERVCQLWQLKELVRSAYPQQKESVPPSKRNVSPLRRYRQALAAGLVLAMGAAMGWFSHEGLESPADLNLMAMQMAEGKVVLHLSSADPERFNAALNEAEALSRGRDRLGHPVRVELVADEGGLTLLRADVSPYAERIRTLGKNHGNLAFLACNNTLEKLRKSGTTVELLPNVEVAPSAKELITARVQHGWTYIKV
jgi:uncharacterized protein